MFKVDLDHKPSEARFEDRAVHEAYEEIVEPVIREASDSHGIDMNVKAYDLTTTVQDPGNEIVAMFLVTEDSYPKWMSPEERAERYEAWLNWLHLENAEKELHGFLQEVTDRSGISRGDHAVTVETVFTTNSSIIIMITMLK